MNVLLTLGMVAASVVLALAMPRRAHAHCDTMDGPTATDGRRALESGNVNHALKWVDDDHEAELGRAFDLARRVRGLGDDARELADRYFLETLVRLHRAGEGAPFTGIEPSGTPIDEKVAAADLCVATGGLAPLAGLVSDDELGELQARFARVLAVRDFDVDDVASGRAYIAAYVDFLHFAEGEEHGHSHAPPHGHDGHAHSGEEHRHGHSH